MTRTDRLPKNVLPVLVESTHALLNAKKLSRGRRKATLRFFSELLGERAERPEFLAAIGIVEVEGRRLMPPQDRLRRWRDPLTGRFIPRPLKAQTFERQFSKDRRRFETATGVPLPDIRPPPVRRPRERISAQLKTRIKSNVLFIRGLSTPCKAWGFIQRRGLVNVDEALLADAVAFTDAARTDLQGLPRGPWVGTVTVVGGCAGDIAAFLTELARDATGANVAKVIAALAEVGTRVAGEITVTWREVVRELNRLGREVERLRVVPGFPKRVFVLGERIREPVQDSLEGPF